jgi:hypothetical protein
MQLMRSQADQVQALTNLVKSIAEQCPLMIAPYTDTFSSLFYEEPLSLLIV